MKVIGSRWQLDLVSLARPCPVDYHDHLTGLPSSRKKRVYAA
jgi:hypothetical protein